jgi:hypothetical protein
LHGRLLVGPTLPITAIANDADDLFAALVHADLRWKNASGNPAARR